MRPNFCGFLSTTGNGTRNKFACPQTHSQECKICTSATRHMSKIARVESTFTISKITKLILAWMEGCRAWKDSYLGYNRVRETQWNYNLSSPSASRSVYCCSVRTIGQDSWGSGQYYTFWSWQNSITWRDPIPDGPLVYVAGTISKWTSLTQIFLSRCRSPHYFSY